MNVAGIARAASKGAKLAVKYGPQAKIVWDKGGRQAAARAGQQASTVAQRRKAIAHAESLIEGTVLRCGPHGSTIHVVFSRDEPVAAYPVQPEPFEELLAHVDTSRRVTPEQARAQSRLRRRSRGDHASAAGSEPADPGPDAIEAPRD